jgi:hypothetical protein
MATKAEVGSAAAEIDEALEKLGGINEENVKLPKAIQGIWIQEDDEGNMLSTTPVVLSITKKGKKGRFQGITFNGYHRPWGRWIYTFVDSTGLLLIEFAAGKGYPRRHVFEQVAADRFELAKDHPLYTEEELWSKNSMMHTNIKKTFFQIWK